ncbi:MAG: ABC transporter permease, partial [Marinirhabdus sp.]
MFSLFRENVRIALDSIRTQLLRTVLTIVIIGIGIWALVGILSAVEALGSNISGNFSSMGANTFNIQRYEFDIQTNNSGARKKVNPIIGYNHVRGFVDRYDFPYANTSVSFLGTR